MSPWLLAWLLGTVVTPPDAVAGDPPGSAPRFKAAPNGEFSFDTGILRGTLRAGGKSLGLSSVVHVPTGRRLDRSNGLFSHYRVFSKGVRYGVGAWDWPSTAQLREDGAVEVTWLAETNRPFEMKATYRWLVSGSLELRTTVESREILQGFEVFLASYFDSAFTNAFALVPGSAASGGKPALRAADPSLGEWLMFPRSPEVVPLIQDGRWQLEPHPVNWTLLPPTEWTFGIRRDPASGLTALMGASNSFAVAMPHQFEAHYSTYLSLFGHTLKPGEISEARALLSIAVAPQEHRILEVHGYLAK